MRDDLHKKYAGLMDPGIRNFMIAGELFYPPDAVNFTMAEQRAFYDRYCEHFRKARPATISTQDFTMGSIACRRYHKAGTVNPPVLLYLHGGGFVLGGLDSHDDACCGFCEGAEVDVVAVEYRLAPEHTYPAQIDDCWAVLQHLAEREPRIIIGGDSAGGNLSAAIAIKVRDAGGPRLLGQVLIYPGLGGDMTQGSYITQAQAPGLSTSDVVYYRDVYKGDGSKLAEPLRETDFTGLPPAFLIAAGLDPLHDDCEAYAAQLRNAGVAAQVRDEPLLVHAFLRARYMSAPAAAAFAAIVAAIHSLAYEGRLPDV